MPGSKASRLRDLSPGHVWRGELWSVCSGTTARFPRSLRPEPCKLIEAMLRAMPERLVLPDMPGQLAIALAHEHRPNLIVLDL